MTYQEDTAGVPSNTVLAEERTYLAAERTLFAVLRTGLAIAGGGSLVITLLGDQWPTWVQVPLVAAFLFVGYAMVLLGLRRYGKVVAVVEAKTGSRGKMLPHRSLVLMIVILQIAVVAVVVLFLVGAFEGASQ